MEKIVCEAVNHMSIPVNDLEESKRFYMDLLGMKEIIDARTRHLAGATLPPRDPLAVLANIPEPKLARLECGGLEVTLFQRPKPIDPKQMIKDNGIFHYSYRMDWNKLEALCQRVDELKAQGYTIAMDPLYRQMSGGGPKYLNLYLYDPNGHLFEVIGWPPKVEGEAKAGVTGHPVSPSA
jgi:catechol 2,3-dioxygenase-like lactoylglutathione lyase family enzyme